MDDLVKQARKALDGVTPGPWLAEKEDPEFPQAGGCVTFNQSKNDENFIATVWPESDAAFIAAARYLVPAMADRIERDAAVIATADALELVADCVSMRLDDPTGQISYELARDLRNGLAAYNAAKEAEQ